MSRYSVGRVSTEMKLSWGAGAWARNGSYGAVGPLSVLSGGGGGVRTVGGAGGGSGRSDIIEEALSESTRAADE